jgi:ribokinase
MEGRAAVVVVGSLHYDIMVRAPYLPRAGETLIGEAWWWKPGGKGGNQAMAAARHGAEVAMIGCLGEDGFGQKLRERLAASGVGLEHITAVAQGSGMSVALEQADGDYAAVVVSGANRQLDEARVAEAADAIAACGVLLVQNEVAESTSATAARMAREAGATVIHNAAPARDAGLLGGLVDILVVNGVEAEQLGADPVADLASAARAAAALRTVCPRVVVTAGGAGVAAATAEGTVQLPPHHVAEPQTHGAGDVFVGALGARLAASDVLTDALRYANAAAALHVGTPGTERDTIGPADVRRMLSKAPRAGDTIGERPPRTGKGVR